MWAKAKSSLLLLSLSFAIELKPPTLPPPEQVEKGGIERKTQGKTPEVQTKDIPQPPPPPPPPKEVIKADPKELRRPAFDIKRGENLVPQVKEEKKSNGQDAKNQDQKPKTVEKGYCKFLHDYEVTLEPVFAQVECLILSRPSRMARGEVRLNPEPDKYALRAELTSLDGREVRSVRVLNADRSSNNVASEVDRRLISNILLRTGVKTGQETSGMVQDIFRQESRLYEEEIYGGRTVLKRREVDEALKQVPKASMYLALANLLGTTSEEILGGRKRLPPLFKVYAGTEIYVEVER